MSGQAQTVSFWLCTFPSWNVNSGCTLFGGTALHNAVIFGRNKLKTVQVLVESGRASLDVLLQTGGSVLSSSVSAADSDPEVVRYLLSQNITYGINYRRRPQTIKWKLIYSLARGLSRTGLATSGLFAELASVSGATPLQWAVKRGDVDIVEILMEQGADPSIKNDLGKDVMSYCHVFPEIKSELLRVLKERGRIQGRSRVSMKKSTTNFTLQRRLSTAIPMKYDMYLLNVGTMLSLFGNDDVRKRNKYICHQDLLDRGEVLIRFEDLPFGAFVMFVSHQWTGFNHPDPNLRHMQVLSSVLRELRDGKHSTETDPFHQLVYNLKTITGPYEWKSLLSNAYIWYDWFSQPQPLRGKSRHEIAMLEQDLNLALDSVGAYVEKSDTLVILTPSSVHVDILDEETGRNTYTCYRTWRRRGFCVLEFFCAHFSRRSTHPVLLVRSEVDAPIWISPLESLTLAVGECNYTCCTTNHLGPQGDSKMKCSRTNVRTVLSKLIDVKASYLFEKNSIAHGRFLRALKHWWLRGLKEEARPRKTNTGNPKFALKDMLEWDDMIESTFFDREGVSLLAYAVCANNLRAATYLINEINEEFRNDEKERQRRIESRLPKHGLLYCSIPGSGTTLIGAMSLASTEMVQLLLKNGANPYGTENGGNTAFVCACMANRVENVKLWLSKFPNWDLESRNTVVGGIALGCR